MQSLAFPMRLKENGLLERHDRAASLIALLQMMARTPKGSWAACPGFGLRDLFEDNAVRGDKARLALLRINEVLADLAITEYVVSDVFCESSPGRGTDTYAITVESTASTDSFRTSLAFEE